MNIKAGKCHKRRGGLSALMERAVLWTSVIAVLRDSRLMIDRRCAVDRPRTHPSGAGVQIFKL